MGILLNLVPWWGRLLAIVAVLVAAAGFGAVKMHAHDQAKYETLQLAYSNFRGDVAAKGEQANREAAAQAAKQKGVEDALRKDLAAADSLYADLARRLRERPPSRPDGSSVPTGTCAPAGAHGPSGGESVPLADYRALEARAAYDAQSLKLYKQWVAGMVLAGALEVK